MKAADRVVTTNFVGDDPRQQVRVSTAFLGRDPRPIDGGGPPMLWETRVFGGALDNRAWHYSTARHAKNGHSIVCRLVQTALIDDE